jgi:predicted TIM-barrel fold metal-dependent hydrolase
VNGVTKKYPDVRFILAHAGGPVPYIAARVGMSLQMLFSIGGVVPYIAAGAGLISSIAPKFKEAIPENLTLYLKFKENMLPEGADFYLKRFYYDTALSASPHAFASLLTLVDSSKIVFGTDYIFATQAAVPLTIKGIREYTGFNAKDIAAIERENAMDLFPRLKKS